MSTRPLPLSFIYALFLSLTLAPLATSASPDPWQEKIDPQLIGQSDVELLIVLEEQADLTPARFLRTKEAKGEFVFRTLVAFADRTQGELLHELERLKAPHRSFWVANLVWARGGPELLEAIAKRPEVSRLHANPWVEMQRPTPEQEAEAIQAIEWGVQMIGADDYWGLGFTGQGVVIAGQDTGYDWDHPALKDHYRGWDGLSANHAYNWHDAIHSGGGSCGADSLEPCDDSQHGTHTMGTMVGDDGGSNQIGVAPGAKWIGCRNMDQGAGTPATYIECWQWFVAPTDLDNLNPDPSKAPHVVNNSWGCPPSEGCTDPEVMRTVVENVRAAGIVPVVSAGNSGPSCSTVSDPAAIYDASISIGSTTSSDTISSFSSRGNVTIDGSGRMKPDVSAPGSSVRSSVPGGGYSTFSGTSMAGPHVAGQVALLISGNPERAGDVDGIELCLKSSAVPKTSATQSCGGVAGTEVPNNTYGWGRVELPASEAGAPSGLLASPDGDNRIALSWSAGAGASSYGVFRATGTTCPGADYEPIASGLTNPSFTDTSASGGVTYSYLVRSAEASGSCFSGSSNCSSATTTGPCLAAPSFAGLASATQPAESTCSTDLSWSSASPICGTTVAYNIYRDTTPGFIPSAGNLVQACHSGTTWTDYGVSSGTTYHYVVRSEDPSAAGSGPCAGGAEDSNTVEHSVTPSGPSTSLLIESFDSGLPAEWTAIDHTGQCPWLDSDPGGRTNLTGGESLFMILDLDECGSGINADAELQTPAFDLSAQAAGDQVEIRFRQDYRNYTSTVMADVEIWNGSSYEILASFAGEDDRGPIQKIFTNQGAIGAPDAHIRWHYQGGGDWWWQIDDVEIDLVSVCEAADGTIFADGFESGDTSAWTSSP